MGNGSYGVVVARLSEGHALFAIGVRASFPPPHSHTLSFRRVLSRYLTLGSDSSMGEAACGAEDEEVPGIMEEMGIELPEVTRNALAVEIGLCSFVMREGMVQTLAHRK